MDERSIEAAVKRWLDENLDRYFDEWIERKLQEEQEKMLKRYFNDKDSITPYFGD